MGLDVAVSSIKTKVLGTVNLKAMINYGQKKKKEKKEEKKKLNRGKIRFVERVRYEILLNVHSSSSSTVDAD